MRISDWSSDVCSSDLVRPGGLRDWRNADCLRAGRFLCRGAGGGSSQHAPDIGARHHLLDLARPRGLHGAPVVQLAACEALRPLYRAGTQYSAAAPDVRLVRRAAVRSEEHTSELPSLMRISYAVFFLKKKT